MGVIDIKTTERNGPVIGAVQVRDDDEIMLITDGGTLVRTAVAEVSTVGRNTQGVRLIRLTAGESLVELTAIDEADANTDELGDELDGDETTPATPSSDAAGGSDVPASDEDNATEGNATPDASEDNDQDNNASDEDDTDNNT